MSISKDANHTRDKTIYEAFLSILGDSGVCALVVTGSESRIVKVNRLLCSVLGKEPQEIIGSTLTEELGKLIESGIAIDTHTAIKNDDIYEVLSFKNPNSLDTIMNDSDLRQAFNGLEDLFCRISLHGIVIDVSPSIISFNGFTREEVIGKSVNKFYVNSDQRDKLIFQLAQEGRVKGFLVDLFRKDGSIFCARGSIHSVFDENGMPCYHEGILSDISEEQRLEKQINKQALFFEKIVESVPDAVLTIDQTGLVTAWNKAAVELFGWTAEEAIGRDVDGLVNANFGNDAIQTDKVLNGEVICGFECVRSGKNSIQRRVSISVAPIIVAGETQGAVAVYTDLSDRNSIMGLLREIEVKFKAITESAQDAVIIMDSEARVTFFSTSAEIMFGYSSSEAIGRELHSLIAPDAYREMINMGMEQFRDTGKGMMVGRVVELEGMRKNRTIFPVELSVSSFFLNEEWQATGILRDISERKRIELELIEAREAALNATRTKSEFLANMSHEIRTPLNAIIGTTDLLLETDLTPTQKNYLRVGRNASDNLLSLINDILDISKVEAGRIELEKIPFNLFEEVEKTCETLALRAHEKGLELNCRIDPATPVWVCGDPSRLKQVITNLIGNSIKFTESGEVTTTVKPIDNGQLMFSVTDTGIGIPEGKVEAIFMSFTQADSSHTRRYGGTGLGLTICTKLVELMGGSISVESEVDKGSLFSFNCDLPEAEPPEQLDTNEYPDFSGCRILLADDNRNNRNIQKELIENWGASVDTAESGIVALEMFKKNSYDAILLDYNMPGMDGSEVADYIKRQGISTANLIIMLDCNNSNKCIEKSRLSGVDRFVFKPLRRRELGNQLLEVIRNIAPTLLTVDITADSGVSIEKMNLSILLAEDSPDNRFLIIKYTEKFPWEITVAENGKEALDQYMQKKFDFILMDMQMPVMDGYEATRSIRAYESISMSEHVPIVALTAHALREEVQKCLAAGCDIHISKPVRKRDLLEKLDELLKIMGPREGTPELEDIPLEIEAEEEEEEEEETETVQKIENIIPPQGPLALVPEDLEALIPGYLKNRRSDIVKIRQLVQEEDFKEAQRLSHSMKGSGGGYGFDKISEIGAAMEIAAKALNSMEILSGIDELENYLNTVRIEYVDEE